MKCPACGNLVMICCLTCGHRMDEIVDLRARLSEAEKERDRLKEELGVSQTTAAMESDEVNNLSGILARERQRLSRLEELIREEINALEEDLNHVLPSLHRKMLEKRQWLLRAALAEDPKQQINELRDEWDKAHPAKEKNEGPNLAEEEN